MPRVKLNHNIYTINDASFSLSNFYNYDKVLDGLAHVFVINSYHLLAKMPRAYQELLEGNMGRWLRYWI